MISRAAPLVIASIDVYVCVFSFYFFSCIPPNLLLLPCTMLTSTITRRVIVVILLHPLPHFSNLIWTELIVFFVSVLFPMLRWITLNWNNVRAILHLWHCIVCFYFIFESLLSLSLALSFGKWEYSVGINGL